MDWLIFFKKCIWDPKEERKKPVAVHRICWAPKMTWALEVSLSLTHPLQVQKTNPLIPKHLSLIDLLVSLVPLSQVRAREPEGPTLPQNPMWRHRHLPAVCLPSVKSTEAKISPSLPLKSGDSSVVPTSYSCGRTGLVKAGRARWGYGQVCVCVCIDAVSVDFIVKSKLILYHCLQCPTM